MTSDVVVNNISPPPENSSLACNSSLGIFIVSDEKSNMSPGGAKRWFGHRTGLEKCLLLSLPLLILLALLPLFLALTSSNHTTSQSSTCLEPSCVEIAGNIIAKMDFSIDPCEDFYLYSCGRWINDTVLPPHTNHWDNFGYVSEDMRKTFYRWIDSWGDSEIEAERKVNKFYLSCLDKDNNRDRLGKERLLEVVQRVGSSRLFDSNWSIDDHPLNDTIHTLILKQLNSALVAFNVQQNSMNSSENILTVVEPDLLMTQKYFYLNLTDSEEDLHNVKVNKQYQKLMKSTFMNLGAVNETFVDQRVQEILEFETGWSEYYINTMEMWAIPGDKRYIHITLEQLAADYDYVDWLSLIRKSFAMVGKTVELTDQVQVAGPQFFEDATPFFRQYFAKKPEVVHDYLLWLAIMSRIPWSSREFIEPYRLLLDLITGDDSAGQADWEICMREVVSQYDVLPFVIGASFAQEMVRSSKKEAIHSMVKEIKAIFRRRLDEQPWLDEETRIRAREKVDMMHDRVAYPDYILNQTWLNDLLKDFDPQPDQYFLNMVNLTSMICMSEYAKLGEPFDAERWEMAPQTVNAYYSPMTNKFVFPAGIFQKPFYDLDRISAMNFGGIGVVVGHELSHGFDNEGKDYDASGNRIQWMTNSTITQFNELAECFVQQYSNYTYFGEQVNGRNTLPENIADNGGLVTSFHAYRQFAGSGTGNERRPYPGLGLTDNQLFFVSFAQIWCEKQTQEKARIGLKIDVHSPSQIRVYGCVSNSPDFAEAFNCPLNSKMNPEVKCKIW